MPLRSLCMLLILLAGSPALAQEDEDTEPRRHVSPTPVWLPRGVFLGTYLTTGEPDVRSSPPLVVTPQLRLQWELTVIQERVDSMVLLAELGGGWAVARTDRGGVGENLSMERLNQFVGIFGLGYRGTLPSGLHLGAHAGVGPLLYRARFSGFVPEQFLAGMVEARAQVGYTFFKGVALGISAGYGSPFGRPARSFGGEFTGGFLVGLFADWR